MYCLVRLVDDVDGDGEMCVISETWLQPGEHQAKIPIYYGRRFQRAVQQHLPVPPNTPNRSVQILLRTESYEQANEMQNHYEQGYTSSSNGQLYVSALSKRPLHTPAANDEPDVPPKRFAISKPATELVLKQEQQTDCDTIPSVPLALEKIHQATSAIQNPRDISSSIFLASGDTLQQREHVQELQPAYETLTANMQRSAVYKTKSQSSKTRDRTVYLLRRILTKISQVEEDVRVIKSVVTAADGDISPFPLASLEKLRELEQTASSPSVQKHLARIINTTSGEDYKQFTRRLLARLMTKSTVASMNYSGANGNYAFRKTFLNSYIINEVQSRTEWGCPSKQDVATVIRAFIHDTRTNLQRQLLPSSKATELSRLSESEGDSSAHIVNMDNLLSECLDKPHS
ncbi:hypothetical protein D915_009604 [Fasciola hepatica]|uniref:DUF4806 domain-containing protein n=1 Tax=Fasciola hepatica TaxID=6192 RepID=A0A4E0RWM5_FASHE|nr:hypothetical protein D915_009604 [Fasciola hepatica]